MASGKYQGLSQLFLNWLFGGGTFAQPTNLYIGLFSAEASVATTGTEASGGSYARVTVACNTTNWPAISGATTTLANGTAITFPTASGTGFSAGVNMVGAGVWSASSAGTLYYWGDLTTPKPVLASDVASFAASAFTIQEL